MRTRSHASKTVVSLVALAPLASIATGTGCAGKSVVSDATDAQLQADSVDANASSAQASQFSELFLSSVHLPDPVSAASSAAESWLWPASCSTRASDAARPGVVTLTFDDCTGPFGLVHVSGGMVGTFTRNADGTLHVALESDHLTANGHPVEHAGSGDVAMGSDGTRTVAWKGVWTRTNASGETVTHVTDVTIQVDANKCRTTNGTAETTVAARVTDSVIDGYAISKNSDGSDGCPRGTIVHSHDGRSLTVTFDGSDRATLTSARGRTTTLPLVCGGMTG